MWKDHDSLSFTNFAFEAVHRKSIFRLVMNHIFSTFYFRGGEGKVELIDE